MALEVVVSWVGTFSGGVMLGAPITTARRFCAARDVGALPITYFVFQFLNCVLWSVYGILIESPPVTLCNMWGVAVATYCALCYLSVAKNNEKTIGIFHRSIRIVGGAVGFAVFFLLFIAVFSTTHQSGATLLTGLISAVFSVAMLASPLETVKMIVETKSAEVLSAPTISCAIVNAAIWTFFGFLRSDPFIYTPNGLGFLFSVGLGSLLVRYGRGSKPMSPKPLPTITPSMSVDDHGALDAVVSAPESSPTPTLMRVSFTGSGSGRGVVTEELSTKHE